MNDFQMADGRRVHLIGDPHLGKKFETGVPQHRRGEREVSQAVHFAAELDADADVIVMIGDLFDNPYVPDGVIVAAARAALSAAERNSDVLYVFMAGNHDVPRDKALVGAWQSFVQMVQGRHDNLIALTYPAAIGGLAFFPWEWGRRADAQVADLATIPCIAHAIGHWDLSVFDGKDDHLAPVAALRAAFGEGVGLWSGHYHKPGKYGDVNCTGSMEPYSHAEDPTGGRYVTLTLSEALSHPNLRDMNVRVVLAPGEALPDIDCLALTHIREREETEKEEVTLSVDDFDFQRLVRERISDRDPRVRGFIEERMHLEPEEQR